MMTFNNNRGKKSFGYQPRHLKDKNKIHKEKLEEINAKEELIKNQKNEIFNEEQKLKNEILQQNELLEKELSKKIQTHEVEIESKKNFINKQKEELDFAEEKLRFEQIKFKENNVNSSSSNIDVSQKELELRKKEEELLALRNKLTTEEKILEKFKEEKIKAALIEQERKEAELKQKEIELKEKELLLLQKKESVLKEEALLIEEKEKHTESIEIENIDFLQTNLVKNDIAKDIANNLIETQNKTDFIRNETKVDSLNNAFAMNKNSETIKEKLVDNNKEISKQIITDSQKLNAIKKDNSKLEELKQKALSMLQDEENRFIALKKEQEEKLRLEKERIENELRIQQEEFKKKEAELQNILKNLDKTKLKLKEEKEKQIASINDNIIATPSNEIKIVDSVEQKEIIEKTNLQISDNKETNNIINENLSQPTISNEIQIPIKSKSIIEEAKSFENSEFFSPDEKLSQSNENILKTSNQITTPIDSTKIPEVKKETEEIEFSKSKFFEKQGSVNLEQASSLCEIFYEGEVAILQLNYKRLTFNKAAEFKKLIDGVIETNSKIILVLNNTQFLDSTVLGVLICSLKKLKQVGGSMKIVSDDNIKSNIFLVSGMEKIFEIHQNVETALASITS